MEKVAHSSELEAFLVKKGALSAPLLSKEKKQALQQVNSLFKPNNDSRWDQLLDSAKRKSFAQALSKDPRADDKLKLHVEQMNRLLTGKPVKTVQGVRGTYTIIKKRGGGLGCTCPDWRYRKSVSPLGEQECKHIIAYKKK